MIDRRTRWGPAITLALAAACTKAPPASVAPGDPQPRVEPDPDPGDEPADDDAALPPAEEVLARAVAALGGRTRLEAVESFHSISSLVIAGQAITARVELWWKGGDYYQRTDAPDVGVAELWKRGREIWADDPAGGRRRLTGKEAEQASIAGALSLPAFWKDYFVSAKTVALRRAEGHALVDVEVVGASGTALTMTFDRETGLLHRLSSVQQTPLGELPSSTTYDDYREVDGIKHPFHSVTRMSMFSSELTVDAIEHGIPIDPTRFIPPTPRSGGQRSGTAVSADEAALRPGQ